MIGKIKELNSNINTESNNNAFFPNKTEYSVLYKYLPQAKHKTKPQYSQFYPSETNH